MCDITLLASVWKTVHLYMYVPWCNDKSHKTVIFMCPTSKKLVGHIALGLSVCPSLVACFFFFFFFFFCIA